MKMKSPKTACEMCPYHAASWRATCANLSHCPWLERSEAARYDEGEGGPSFFALGAAVLLANFSSSFQSYYLPAKPHHQPARCQIRRISLPVPNSLLAHRAPPALSPLTPCPISPASRSLCHPAHLNLPESAPITQPRASCATTPTLDLNDIDLAPNTP
jgi:hypothetical protein